MYVISIGMYRYVNFNKNNTHTGSVHIVSNKGIVGEFINNDLLFITVVQIKLFLQIQLHS